MIEFIPLVIAVSLGAAAAAPLTLLMGRTRKAHMATDPFEKWLRDIEKRVPRTARVSPHMYLLGAGVFVALWVWLDNPVPALLGAAFVILIPENLMFRRALARRDLVLQQLSSAVRIFAGEFAATPQVHRGLNAVGRRVPDPVGRIFRRAHAGLLYGRNPDEVYLQMIRDLDSAYGHMFVQILRAAEKKGAMAAPLFHELVSKVTVAQELAQHNKSELTMDRLVGLFLTIAPLPLYFLLTLWLPNAHEFFAGTTAGQAVIALCFVSAIAWFFVDRVVSEA